MPRRADEAAPTERVFRENLPALYRLAYALLRQREEAEDAVQDTWLRLAGVGAARHPRGLMFRVLRNLCTDRLRARRTHLRLVRSDVAVEALSVPLPPPVPGDDDEAEAEALARTLAAVDRMPGELAEILTLVVIEGMRYREAAEALDIPVGTVRSRLNRARRTLRRMLEEEKAGVPRIAPSEGSR